MAAAWFSILFRPWRWIASFPLWSGLQALLPQRTRPQAIGPADATPMTEEQRKWRKTEYIESIDRDAVCALASRHNGGLPCRLDESRPSANGSFNVSFFVEFHTTAERTQWVIRIPIETVVHSPWEKVQSEVCTIRHVQTHTNIPVPQVHAYGRAQLRYNKKTEPACYMILERVGGEELTVEQLTEAPEQKRRQFYTELIVMLAQLRGLNFKAAGSLMPNSLWAFPIPRWLQAFFSPAPVVVSAISMPLNEIQVRGVNTIPPQDPPTSTAAFIASARRLLWDIYLVPYQDMKESGAQYELFALHTLLQQEPLRQEHVNSQPEHFVLTHTDLRGPNIMVDKQLQIQAIIDWEWAVAVPAAFHTPPFWFMLRKDIRAEFYSALASLSPSRDPSIPLLQKQWMPPDGDNLIQHMGCIFEEPNCLTRIFYESIYPRLSDVPANEARKEFFLSREWQEEARKRVQNSERYTQYLKANGLYKVDEEAEKQSSW